MKFMAPKRKLQSPPKQDDNQESYALGDSNRSRMDDGGDEIAIFFALVDRIRATNKMMKQKHATFDPAKATSTAAENTEVKIVTSKSLWKPSFEWEDFSYGDMMFGGNGQSSNVWDSANNSASSLKEIQKPDIGIGEGKRRSVESFDLNAEPPSEHLVP